MSLNLYPIIKELGDGGFGKTYLATNTLLPARPYCVIKQLKPVTNDPQLQQLIQDRFEKEAIILEGLGDGSNGMIPRLYAYFVDQGEFYLAQEYIDGQTLNDRVRSQGIFTEPQVRDLLTNILPTLSYVHSRGIVHRDIKPDNIMLRQRDNKPILIDFGAVKETMSTMVNNSGNSTRSIVIGTPGFMPVEQMSGRPMYASDIYALGLTAIYLLTGKLPAEIETDPSTGDINWQPHALNVSPQLIGILNKAIQASLKDRYIDAQEMLQALVVNSTQIQQPAAQVSASKTLVSPIPSEYQQTTVYSPPDRARQFQQHSKDSNDSSKPIIIGVAIGSILIVSGLLLGKTFQQSNNERSDRTVGATIENQPNPVKSINQEPVTKSPDANRGNSTPAPVSKEAPLPKSSGVERLGWLRLGSVNTQDGNISVGQRLITTSQPVTIDPPRVPSIGDRVMIINPVNLRVSSPQPPNYSLPEKKGAFPPGQKVVIINTDAFVDTTSSSPYTVVWAEIGVKQ
jgi:serine/threonine protein kinase